MIEEIRRRLSLYSPQERPTEGRPRAAVLIPLYANAGEVHVVFTKRSDHVQNHKGEISFPGGAMDTTDADLTATALRESDEEIGLRPEHVRVLGRLNDSFTISRFHVAAYVGEIDPASCPYVWRPQVAEVSEVLEVPLTHLLDRANLVEVPLQREDRIVVMEGFRFGEHVIWGATGRILRNFLDVAFATGAA